MAAVSQFSQLQKTADGKFHLSKKVADGTIDPYELIQELSAVKTAQVEYYQDKIDINTNKKTPALEELRTKAKTLQNCLEKLTNDPRINYGSTQSYSNALSSKAASVKKSDANPAVSIRADTLAKATENDHKINVTQISSKDRVKCGLYVDKSTDQVGFSGTLSVNNALITIDTTDTIYQICNKINASSVNSNVNSTVVQVSEDGGYYLMIEANDFATPINFYGTPPTSPSLFGLAPRANTPESDLADVGAGPLQDVIESEYYCSDHAGALDIAGDLVLNGHTFTITKDMTTLDDLIDAINGNVSANITASYYTTTTERGDTVYGLKLTGNVAGSVIDFTDTSSSLLGIVPSVATTDLASGSYDSITSGFIATDADVAMGVSGNLVLQNETFTLTETTTLTELMNLINENDKVDLTAELALVDGETNQFRLKLTNTIAGEVINMLGCVPTEAGLLDDAGLKVPPTTTSLDDLIAKFTFNGIEMTRDSNTIKNLMPNVTFSLITPSEDDTIFSIEYMKQDGYDAVKNFVDAYNDVMRTLHKHKQENPDGTPAADATLYGDRVITQFEYLLRHVQEAPTLGNKRSSTSYMGLSDIGISFTTTKNPGDENIPGMMLLNTGTLSACIADKSYDDLIRLFGNYCESSNPMFSVFDVGSKFPSRLLGKDIAVTYRYDGVKDGDSPYTDNFTMLEPSVALNESVAGKAVTITYTQSTDTSFSIAISGIEGQATVTVDNVLDGHVVMPANSIFKGLKFDFIGTAPAIGNSIVATVKLPEYVAVLSCSGEADVTISNVRNNIIEGPVGSIYEGLVFGYQYGSTSPLSMGGGTINTTLSLTKGIAVGFLDEVAEATLRTPEGQDATGLVDLAVMLLDSENETNTKRISDAQAAAERQRKGLEPFILRLYNLNESLSQVLFILDKMTNAKK